MRSSAKFSIIACLILLSGIFFNPQIVAADDISDVVKSAPNGLSISKYFTVGQFELNDNEDSIAYPFKINSSEIVDAKGDATSDGKVLRLATGGETNPVTYGSGSNETVVNTAQAGAAWSKRDSQNYIDISKKQTVSVWLYFGSADGDDPTKNGEGISLVLQNDNRGESAMGASYQGLGVMGYDQSQTNQTKNLLTNKYSDDTFNNSLINSPEGAASMAIQNSMALNFEAQSNSLISTVRTPALVGYSSDHSTGLIGFAKGRYKEFTLGSFDTAHDTYAAPSDFPERDLLLSSSNLGEHPLRMGNSANPYGTIYFSYPANASTYKTLNLDDLRNDDAFKPSNDLSNPWSLINLNKKGQALSAFQVGAQNANLVDGEDADGNPLYWHHLTFTWNPKTATSPATIEYKFNDKFPDGTINNGQGSDYNEITETIPVDVSQFGTLTDNKVYWGLTGSNGTNDNSYSKLAIFESMPSLATARIDTTLYDKSDNNKAITDSSSDNKVYNDDNLAFDYHLTWDADESREDWQDIVAKLNLPSDVDYNSATITYHNSNGDSTPETIAKVADLNSGSWKYTLANNLGNKSDTNGYTSADITVNGTADNQTDSPITVDPEPASFSGSNAIETTSTPKFVIDGKNVVNKYLDLEVTPTLQFQDVNYKTANTILYRKSDFDLSVTSLKEPWKLSATTTGLYKGTQPFYGNLIYKQTDISKPIVLTDDAKVVAQDNKSYTTKTTDDIAASWDNNSGLLLSNDVNKIDSAGTYTGTINWTAINSI